MPLIDKFVPFEIHKTIFDIDFEKLKKDNRKYIVFDLDNTIIPYHKSKANEDAKELVNKLKEMGFIVLIMSNNHSKRINLVANDLDVFSISNSKKPFKSGYKKLIKKYNITDLHDVIAIGDQLVTDCFGARRNDIDCIFVNAIDQSSEKWYTRLTRKYETSVIKKFKKKHPETYKAICEARGVYYD